ncbi:MAG: type II toxin-antitoxin system RelB/DinJ family antitoxin [Clostridia bacterium]|nr:type II toxin-antitoxin system RelB/DinJ family antitoxin [Clostridia bacterium]
MANSSAVYARIDNGLKTSAEDILSKLGISPSSAIQMFYRQIIIHNGLPFELRLRQEAPVAAGALTKEAFDAELMKGVEDIRNGKVVSLEEADRLLAEDPGI